jgi:glycine/D-amino acid oxidase-like deaminating enzyme/nitrite reductase/ring-hydroxylating ferredoxin subunit
VITEKNKSIWTATSRATTYPKLDKNVEVDVAVLGGGIAGLITAYFLKQAGQKVAVIEARRIASGTTGNTTAHITIAHSIIYDELINNFGYDFALDYARANQEGINLIDKIIQKEGIECDFKNTDEYIFTDYGDSNEDKTKREFEATKKLRLGTEWLQHSPLPYPSGGTIKYKNQARFHPRKFLVELAGKIDGEGSIVFEETRALDIKEGDLLEIETDQGNLKAKKAVVATLYPFLDRGGYFTRLDTYTSYVLACQIEGEFPDAMFDSTEESSHYLRIQPEANSFLVLVGGEGHKTGEISKTDLQYQKLEEYARKNLKIKSIEYKWSTHDTYPVDNVPYIGKFMTTTDNIYVITGLKGYGIAHSSVGGKIIRDLIVEDKSEYEEIFNPNRINPRASLKSQIGLGAKSAKELAKSKLGKTPQLNIDDLKRGEGRVFENNGDKLAVYKDDKGKVYTVSAKCQHMGCQVNFNQAEETWDCPCHGSRYTIEGKMISGPTTKDLPKRG